MNHRLIVAARMLSACGLALCLALAPAHAANKYKTINLSGDWTGVEGCKVTVSNGDEFTCNFGTGNAGECAQELVDAANADADPFTASRVGTKVTICYPDRTPKIEKVNVKNNQLCSVDAGSTEFLSTALIECRGVAIGGGLIEVEVEDLQVQILTNPGQSAYDIIEALHNAFDELVPGDDDSYAFGLEYTATGFNGPPVDSVDLGIYSMGPRNVQDGTFFRSSDPGIQLSRRACNATPVEESTWGRIKAAYR